MQLVSGVCASPTTDKTVAHEHIDVVQDSINGNAASRVGSLFEALDGGFCAIRHLPGRTTLRIMSADEHLCESTAC